MDFQIIISTKLINKSELARLLWPETTAYTVRWSMKINEKQGQRFTDAEKARIVQIVTETLKL